MNIFWPTFGAIASYWPTILGIVGVLGTIVIAAKNLATLGQWFTWPFRTIRSLLGLRRENECLVSENALLVQKNAALQAENLLLKHQLAEVLEKLENFKRYKLHPVETGTVVAVYEPPIQPAGEQLAFCPECARDGKPSPLQPEDNWTVRCVNGHGLFPMRVRPALPPVRRRS